MGEAINVLNELKSPDTILVTDVGQHQMVASRYFRFEKTKGNVTSGGLGTMGFALPASLGAKLGAPEREVVCVVGDGGFQMTVQELATIAQEKANVKILLLNNNYLGMVRQWQELFFGKRYSHTEMTNPDFQTLAKGFGIKTKKVSERKFLKDAMKEMLKTKNAFLLEVIVEKEENVFPMIPTGKAVDEIRLK